MTTIHICPSCGCKNVKKVRRNLQGEFQGQKYTVKNLEYYECSDCGEKIYDRNAMQAIESQSPAFAKSIASAE